MGTGKKKGRGKKRGGLKVNERIMLVPETIEIFGLLNLEPPSTVSGVVDAVKRLKDKKIWFSTLERGATLSIRDKQWAEQAGKHGALGFNAVDLASAEDAFPSLPNQASPAVG